MQPRVCSRGWWGRTSKMRRPTPGRLGSTGHEDKDVSNSDGRWCAEWPRCWSHKKINLRRRVTRSLTAIRSGRGQLSSTIGSSPSVSNIPHPLPLPPKYILPANALPVMEKWLQNKSPSGSSVEMSEKKGEGERLSQRGIPPRIVGVKDI